MSDLVYDTGLASFCIQIITGIIDVYVLTLKYDASANIVKGLLIIELFVQVIEATFYIWMVSNFANINNITPVRYYDWLITTPSMLYTYTMYLNFINNKHNNSLYEMTIKNIVPLTTIGILNTIMLAFGYISELKWLSYSTGAIFGFIPFIVMFYIIYHEFAKFTNIGKITFWYFVTAWALYGISSLLSYKWKNVFYNILDLFSKNFFGLFLAFVLYKMKR
tara:strand:+ start:6398 stop:7060 length:663 start_codon:yes stop_codon:yes gene_type:complete